MLIYSYKDFVIASADMTDVDTTDTYVQHMAEPSLRTVNKAVAPFAVNKFPSSFVETLAQNIVYMMATKQSMSCLLYTSRCV